MKRALILSIGLLTILAVATTASAQTQPPRASQQAGTAIGPNFVDLDGDGICDNNQSASRAGQAQRGRRGGFGPGDGTGNQHVGPKDGTGYGPGAGSGAGICDGTGPKGNAARKGAGKGAGR